MKLLGAEEDELAERDGERAGQLGETDGRRVAAEEEIEEELLAIHISILPSHRFKIRQYSTRYPPVKASFPHNNAYPRNIILLALTDFP